MEQMRSYSWHTTAESLGAARGLSGFEYLQKLMAGEFPPPPIASTMGFQLVELRPGRAVFTLVPQEWHYNPIGTVHGGVLATLCDSAMGCAVHSQLPLGTGYTTQELKTNYLRPLSKDSGEVRCVGEVLYLGSRQATAASKVFSSDGKLVAHSTTTCMVFRG